jgi:hypothetical protein
MSRKKLWLGLVITITLVLINMASCAKTEQVPAPTVSPQHPAPPLLSPSILGVRADVGIDDGNSANDVSFGINEPGYALALDWAGDVVYYLDVIPPLAEGQSALTADGTYQSTFETTVLWKDLSPGMHTFSAQLVKPDQTPLGPHVDTSVEIEVPVPGTDKPFIRSLSIQVLCRPGYRPPNMPGRPEGASACADIDVISNIGNFKVFADKIGQPTVPGEGHFIYYFNVSPPTDLNKPALTGEGTYAITGDSITSWVGVLPGEYKVWVQLVNNDNTPLEPPVLAGGSIIVPIEADRY